MSTFLKRLFVTGFFTGYAPIAPGTVGTLVGVIIYLLLYRFPYILYPMVILLFIFGVKYSSWAETYFREKDSNKIVIDEIVGYLVAMANVRINYSCQDLKFWIVILSGFLLFRFFDIIKPFYINDLQKLKGGLGVMMDDLLAGVYANLILLLFMMFL
ncbi:MAG: phosphatidylglycerophosphatase A [Spirochaetes bacterium]|nr:phosphatidylglycerophosphatase A [Spirochaetota bacterium]